MVFLADEDGRACKRRRVCADLTNALTWHESECMPGNISLRGATPWSIDVKRFTAKGSDVSPMRSLFSIQEAAAPLEDDSESQILCAMHRSFSQDSLAGSAVVHISPSIGDSDVYLVLNRQSSGEPPVVGYVSMVPSFEHGIELNALGLDTRSKKLIRQVSKRLPLMTQLYVEHEFRKRGIATAALRILLRGVRALVVDAPSRPALLALEKLKFKLVGARAIPQGSVLCLFVRVAKNDENKA